MHDGPEIVPAREAGERRARGGASQDVAAEVHQLEHLGRVDALGAGHVVEHAEREVAGRELEDDLRVRDVAHQLDPEGRGVGEGVALRLDDATDEADAQETRELGAALVEAAHGAHQAARAREREDRPRVRDDEAVARRWARRQGKIVPVVAVGDREDAPRVDEREALEQVGSKLVRGRDDGVGAAEDGRLERARERPDEGRARHLVRGAEGDPLVAVVEDDPEAARARERGEEKLREGRPAHEHHVVTPSGDATGERRLSRGLPEHLRIGEERVPCHTRHGAHASRREAGAARIVAGQALPGRALRRVRRLERAHASDLDARRHVAQERLVAHGDAGVGHREDGRLHPVVWKVLGQLDDALDAGAAHGREGIRDEQGAEVHDDCPRQCTFRSRCLARVVRPIIVPTMPSPSRTPLVTIAIPCRDEEAHIEQCMRAVQAQQWPGDRLEILVADGMSVDATREILARLAAEDARIQIVDNPAHVQAAGLNECIRRARGEVIVRMDVHATYAPDFVARCVDALDRTGADNVGGAARPMATTFFQRCVAAALQSPLGIGGSRFRKAESEGFVETVWPGAFRRSVFERIGMFDPNAVTNEDAELNQRILDSGGRVYMSRDIVSHYFPRASMRTLARQYFRYGQGRARTLLKHGRLPSLRPALPFLGLLGEAFVLVTAPWHIGGLSVAAYTLATGAEAVRVGRREGLAAIPVVWAIFPVLHASHGAGFAVGLVKYAIRPDWSAPERPGPAGRAPTVVTAAQ